MIKDCRNMPDAIPSRRGGGAQRQIMKFSSFKSWPQEPDRINQCAAIDGKVVDIVLGKQQIRIPARFEPRTSPLPVRTYLIMVGIDDVSLLVFTEFKRHLIKCVFRQDI